MIRDLISSNSFFREKIEFYKQFIETQEKEMFALMRENQILREKDPLPALPPSSQDTGPISLAEFASGINKKNPKQNGNHRLMTYGDDLPSRQSKAEL